MRFDDLIQFIERNMRIAHVYPDKERSGGDYGILVNDAKHWVNLVLSEVSIATFSVQKLARKDRTRNSDEKIFEEAQTSWPKLGPDPDVILSPGLDPEEYWFA